jgi:hypothetical protein
MEYSHHFNRLKVPYGDEFIKVSGTATYQLEDLSSGEYGDPEELHAFFFKATIRNYETKDENPISGLTKKDLEKIEEIVVETLNDDYELCSTLPNDHESN